MTAPWYPRLQARLTAVVAACALLTGVSACDEGGSKSLLDVGTDIADAGAGDAESLDAADTAVWEQAPAAPTEGYEARRAAWFETCVAEAAPDASGGFYAQVCRVAAGEPDLDDDAIDDALTRVDERRDTADFRMNGLLRLLYLDDRTGALGDERRARIEASVLGFRYWLTEPGDDGMAFWTENHQILFHTAEFLAGQRHPDATFDNSGMTGREHAAHARPRLIRWLELRARYGFSEWHSNVYFNEDIPALLNLVDFADDDELVALASIVLDIVVVDLAHNMYAGRLATTHGRTYESKFVNGLQDSTTDVAWMTLALAEPDAYDNFSATFMATSAWFPSAPLEALAQEVEQYSEHRQRDSFDVAEGPELGISWEGEADVVVWAGLSAIVAPDVIDGAMQVMDTWDLWDGFLFGSLPAELTGVLRGLIGTPGLRNLAVQLDPLSQGIALEAIDTYVYRTPSYQLAGAQDYKPGMWSAQTLMWRATLSPQAWVFTNAPGVAAGIGDVDDITIDQAWIGGWQPRITLSRDVGVIQYRRLPVDRLVETLIVGEGTRAWFPRDAFDEVRQDGGWTFGRAGDGYLGLWSQHPTQWRADHPAELGVESNDNVWVVQMGDADTWDSFDLFVDAVLAAPIDVVDGIATYQAPGRGLVEVGWEGPMTIDGEPADIGPYERFEHETTAQERGSGRLTVELSDLRLEIDADARTRTVYRRAAP